MLKVENIRFGYVPAVDIFRDVTFTIEGGEYIAIGGRNGCGKTTITRLLVGLEKAREGHMCIITVGTLRPCRRLNGDNLSATYFNSQIAKCSDLP